MARERVTLALEVEPRELTLAQRDDFRISLSATNRGWRTVDPHLHDVALLVNGEEPIAWILAIGNGRREASWHALPPGKTVSMTWSHLGEALLSGPGVFTLVLEYSGTQYPPIEVRVRDDSETRP